MIYMGYNIKCIAHIELCKIIYTGEKNAKILNKPSDICLLSRHQPFQPIPFAHGWGYPLLTLLPLPSYGGVIQDLLRPTNHQEDDDVLFYVLYVNTRCFLHLLCWLLSSIIIEYQSTTRTAINLVKMQHWICRGDRKPCFVLSAFL